MEEAVGSMSLKTLSIVLLVCPYTLVVSTNEQHFAYLFDSKSLHYT